VIYTTAIDQSDCSISFSYSIMYLIAAVKQSPCCTCNLHILCMHEGMLCIPANK